jgi:hypothetical protein
LADARIEPSGSIKCNSFYQWSPDAEYLDSPMEAAVAALQEAKRRVEVRARVADREFVDFEAATVGRRMLQYINELIESVPRS